VAVGSRQSPGGRPGRAQRERDGSGPLNAHPHLAGGHFVPRAGHAATAQLSRQ
jgi:hypothetical protein